MNARDIMMTTFGSVAPETSVLDAAAVLDRERISAVMVLKAGKLVGVLSETDLPHRYGLGAQPDPPGRSWLRRLLDGDSRSVSYVQAHAMKVQDIMTQHVVSVTENTPVAHVAALFEKHKIKQAPVMKAGLVVGVVNRADFVSAFLERAAHVHRPHPHGARRSTEPCLPRLKRSCRGVQNVLS